MQIIRSMLSKYTTDFEKYIKNNNEKILPNFGKLTLSQIPFTSNDKQEKNSNLGNIMLGIGTFAGIIGLGFLSMKNLSKSKQHLKEGIENTKDLIKLVVAKSEENSKTVDSDLLEHMFMSIDDGAKDLTLFIKEQINFLKWKQEDKNAFLEKIINKIKNINNQSQPELRR